MCLRALLVENQRVVPYTSNNSVSWSRAAQLRHPFLVKELLKIYEKGTDVLYITQYFYGIIQRLVFVG